MGTAYSPRIITNGLILYLDAANYKSYPRSGITWYDLSPLKRNGTLVGTPTYSNGSFTFDGASQFVDMGNIQGTSTGLNTAAGTISYWIKFTNTIEDGYNSNQRPWGGGGGGEFEVRHGGNSSTDDRKLSADIGFSTSPTRTNQNTWYNTIWYNVTVAWDSSIPVNNIYVNGILDIVGITSDTATLIGRTGNFYIARSDNASIGYVNGQIPVFQAYNRMLSGSEVQQNFNALRGRFGV